MNTDHQQQEQQTFYQEGYQSTGYHQPYTSESQAPYTQYQPLNGQVIHEQQEVFPTGLPHTDARFVAALTYSVGWLSGLLFVLFATERRYVRYHALQALIFFGGINLLDVMFVSFIARAHHFLFFLPGPFVFFAFLGFLLLNFIAFVGWLVAMVQAYRGKYYRLPVAGTIVTRILQINAPLK